MKFEDRLQSPEEFSAQRVSISGSRTIQRYTSEILARGFSEIGWDVVPVSDSTFRLYQIHGAPHSVEDDSLLIDELARLSREDLKIVVLIHRPDEVQCTLPKLRAAVRKIRARVSLVFLGNLFVNDPFFSELNVPVRIVPHGFFSPALPSPPRNRVVVGTHTTWGEMRVVEHAVGIVARVVANSRIGSVVGYLGGIPHNELRESKIREMIQALDLEREIEIVQSYDHVQDSEKKRVLVVNPGPEEPKAMQPIFNVQLYTLNGLVRLGESSGSLHMRSCIPVIFEANGIETCEELKVVRVSYDSDLSVSRNGITLAAQQINKHIEDGTYISLLKHNSKMAKKFSPQQVAQRYAELFAEMSV